MRCAQRTRFAQHTVDRACQQICACELGAIVFAVMHAQCSCRAGGGLCWHAVCSPGGLPLCCPATDGRQWDPLSLCRSLRQRPGLQMQRVRCDLRDFDPAGLCWQAPEAGAAAQPAASKAMLHCSDCRARWAAGHGVCLAHRPPAGQRRGQNGHQLAAEGQAGSRASKNEPAEQQRAAAAARESSKGQSHGLGPGAPWVAYGKHLCGAATDFALRCCSRAVATGSSARPSSPGQSSRASLAGQAQAAASDGASATAAQETPDRPNKVVADGSSACPAAQGAEHGAVADTSLPLLEPGRLQGLAIAVCCHHRCTWRQYVGKPMFERLGFSPEEFEVVSWMTGE